MRRVLSILAWNLGLLATGLLIVELIFGGWLDAARRPGLWRLSIYRDVEWHFTVSDKYPRQQPTTYRRDTWGLRGDYGLPSDITMLVMGGSTTDERFVSEGETWTDVLSGCLHHAGREERVANAGVAGQSTRGHLRNFDLWFPWIDGLAPRTILFYIGVNERALEGRLSEDDVTAYNESKLPLGLERMRQKSAILALINTIRGNLMAKRAGLHAGQALSAAAMDAAYAVSAGNTTVIDGPDYRRRLAEEETRQATYLSGYRRRLEQLVARSQAFGARPMLITQAEAAWRRDGQMVRGDLDEYFAMSAINQVTLTVCREAGLTCIDLGNAPVFGNGDFYDGVHTTAQGSRKVGEFVCRALLGS